MKCLIVTVLMSTLIYPQSESDINLIIGWRLAAHRAKESKSRTRIGTHVSSPYIEKYIDDIRYMIAYDEKTLAITYINTSDLEFRTADGLKVGSHLKVNQNQVTIHPKWEIHGPETRDGWRPVIGYDRPAQKHNVDGIIIEEAGDPTSGFETSHIIEVKILSFSKVNDQLRFSATKKTTPQR